MECIGLTLKYYCTTPTFAFILPSLYIPSHLWEARCGLSYTHICTVCVLGGFTPVPWHIWLTFKVLEFNHVVNRSNLNSDNLTSKVFCVYDKAGTLTASSLSALCGFVCVFESCWVHLYLDVWTAQFTHEWITPIRRAVRLQHSADSSNRRLSEVWGFSTVSQGFILVLLVQFVSNFYWMDM